MKARHQTIGPKTREISPRQGRGAQKNTLGFYVKQTLKTQVTDKAIAHHMSLSRYLRELITYDLEHDIMGKILQADVQRAKAKRLAQQGKA